MHLKGTPEKDKWSYILHLALAERFKSIAVLFDSSRIYIYILKREYELTFSKGTQRSTFRAIF